MCLLFTKSGTLEVYATFAMFSTRDILLLAALSVALYSSISFGHVLPRSVAVPQLTNGSASLDANEDSPVYYTCQVIAILSDESLNATDCTGVDSLPGGYDVSIITVFKDRLNCTAAEIVARQRFAAMIPPGCGQYIITTKLCRGC